MNAEPGTRNGVRIAGIRIQRMASAKFIEIRRKTPSVVRQNLKKRTHSPRSGPSLGCPIRFDIDELAGRVLKSFPLDPFILSFFISLIFRPSLNS